MQMTLTEAIELARTHLHRAPMLSSATLCLDEALANQAAGRAWEAGGWAVRSLRYSVGIFHPDYWAAKQALDA